MPSFLTSRPRLHQKHTTIHPTSTHGAPHVSHTASPSRLSHHSANPCGPSTHSAGRGGVLVGTRRRLFAGMAGDGYQVPCEDAGHGKYIPTMRWSGADAWHRWSS